MERLGRVQNVALRISLGVGRSTRVSALEAEAFRPSLALLRFRDLDLYLTSLLFRHPSHRLVRKLFDTSNSSLICRFFRDDSMARGTALRTPLVPVPHWLDETPRVYLSHKGMPERARTVLPHAVVNQIFQASVCSLGLSGTFVYTDGSLDSAAGVGGAAFHVPALDFSRGFHLEGAVSSTQAELLAILQALAWASSNLEGDIVIFTDSKAAIHSVIALPRQWTDPLVNGEISNHLRSFTSRGSRVSFVWVPAHVGVPANEVADEVAKRALDPSRAFASVKCLQPLSSLRKQTHSHHVELWKIYWKRALEGNIRLTVDDDFYPPPLIIPRRFDSCFHRLRVGRALTNHLLFQQGKIDSPACEFCGNEEDTIQHFLLECPAFSDQRTQLTLELRVLGLSPLNLCSILGKPPKGVPWSSVLAAVRSFLALTGRFV